MSFPLSSSESGDEQQLTDDLSAAFSDRLELAELEFRRMVRRFLIHLIGVFCATLGVSMFAALVTVWFVVQADQANRPSVILSCAMFWIVIALLGAVLAWRFLPTIRASFRETFEVLKDDIHLLKRWR